MKRRSSRLLCLLAGLPLALAACAPAVPDSGAGVGFQDYNSYIHNAGTAAAAPAAGAAYGAGGYGAAGANGAAGAAAGGFATAPASFDAAAATAAFDRAEGGGSAAPLNAIPYNTTAPAPAYAAPAYAAPAPAYAASAGSGAADRPRGDAPMGIQAQSGEVAHSNPTISDENDFSAVSSRESIASDAERIARNRSDYIVVQPKDLPQRPGDSGPNIVAYALATTHTPGVQMFSRGGLIRKDPNVACAKFASPDLAQQEFLAKGGPDKDRLGIDPDGDGFACGWDPRPFRTALQ